MYVTLEEAKRQLNVDHSIDDAEINDLIEVAESIVEGDIGVPLSDFVDGNNVLDKRLWQAIRLQIANQYANREPVAFGSQAVPVPYSYQFLITKLRKVQ